MSNTYIAKTKAAEAAFSVGEFEHEFTIEEETNWLASGLLEIVPRRYRVLLDTEVYGVRGTDADPTFEAAMSIENEAGLIAGGHIERVKTPALKKTTKEASK